MNLAEWHEVLATEPLTRGQLGAIVAEFRRLGLAGDADRAERLAVTAALAGLGELDSTRSLTMGEAGRAIHALRGCRDRAGLPAAGPAAGAGDAGDAVIPDPAGDRMSLGQAIALMITAWRENAAGVLASLPPPGPAPGR